MNNKISSKIGKAYFKTKEELEQHGMSINGDIDLLMKMLITNIDEELSKPIELKIKRSDDAKKFPLIHTKRDGDVGFDLPAIFPYKEKYKDESIRNDMYKLHSDEEINKLDIKMRETRTVHPHERVVIPTGIYLEIPYGYWVSIEARSSTSKDMLICPKGVIDEGYRGELFAVLLNVGQKPVTIEHGDRVVQMIIHKRENINIKIREVDELSESDRGSDGFGSTGRK